jgi:polysaccharide pyruvyl transferase WcaK-like protein
VRCPVAICQELAFLVRSFGIARSLDVLVVNGGGQLTDWGGPWAFTYTVFKWVLLARLAGVRCIFVNVGAGPLTVPLSQWFARRALMLASYVSFRDERSRALVLAIGLVCAGQVFPDTVYSLDIDVDPTPPISKRAGAQPLVGIAPMSYHDPRVSFEKDQSAYERYIAVTADFTTWLVAHGYHVVLFGSDIGQDPLAIGDLEAAARQRGAPAEAMTRAEVGSLDDLLTQMAAMDSIVTSRYHGVVFAHLLNKPVLAISTHPKVATLMDDLGLSKFCVAVDGCDVEGLSARFLALSAEADDVQRRMTRTRATFRRQLSDQFDELFPREAA